MKLVSYMISGRRYVGISEPDGIRSTGFEDVVSLISAGRAGMGAALATAQKSELVSDIRPLAPIASPGKLLFCGINFRGHQDEVPDAVLPTSPFFFSKLPSAVIGPGEPIICPAPDTKLDYEVELAAIIGRTATHVAEEHALEHVFGYSIVNDISARDIQFTDQQITLGKGYDTFCPFGPAIVTADDIPDPQGLLLSTLVNGELRQSASTDEQLFTVAFLIAFLSAHVTLNPGDVISTGTPAGVGAFRTPPVYLKPGDRVEVRIDQIGVMENVVQAGW